MAYETISRTDNVAADNVPVARQKPNWLKRISAIVMLPIILILLAVRPSLFENDLD